MYHSVLILKFKSLGLSLFLVMTMSVPVGVNNIDRFVRASPRVLKIISQSMIFGKIKKI
jgi:hypothetical protein